MDFLSERVYTPLNADELKIGSEVFAADSLESLKLLVTGQIKQGNYKGKLIRVETSDYSNRFLIDTISRRFILAYLVSEPEEKKLKWTDLKRGDWIKKKTVEAEVIAIDRNTDESSHIFIFNKWVPDKELREWEKVEDD